MANNTLIERILNKTMGFIASITSCPLCGKNAENYICSACQKNFLFSVPQDFITRNFIFNTLKTGIVLRYNAHLPKYYINTYFLCLYKYSYISKILFNSIKYANNRIALWGLKELIDNYIGLDPFLSINRIKNILSKAQLILFTYIPMSHLSRYQRNLQVTKFLAKYLKNHFIKWGSTKSTFVFIHDLIKAKKHKISQKQLNRVERLVNAQKNIRINKKALFKVIKVMFNSKLLKKGNNRILIILLDDVTTTGATLYSASKVLLEKMLKILKQEGYKNRINNILKIDILLFTMFCVD